MSKIRNPSQNQNTVEINRQIIHPRRNRNFQTPRVHFDIPQSPSQSTPENPIGILPETPTLLSQRSTSSLPSDYLGSTPTSEQIRENPFNPTNQTSRLPYWTTHSFTQGEPNLINDPIDISTDTTTSLSLPETLSLPSTPSISQISPPPFNLNFPNNLDARYREQSSTNIPLRLDWNTFTAPPPLFGQHLESNRLHNWALNRLQYRQDIHEDIRAHNIQILQQNSLQLKFEITVKLNNITQHPYPLNPPNITAQSLPSPFFLNFTYCIKDTNLHGILRNYDPITQMYIFCPITKTFNAEESRPFLIPHEFVQPIEIPILEFIHNTKYNHKLYNLIQNTLYDFAVGTEELKTIKALQLLWPLLQTKNIIRILAKLLTNSDIIQYIFPHGFFPDD